jgi:YHS domain-containing protein
MAMKKMYYVWLLGATMLASCNTGNKQETSTTTPEAPETKEQLSPAILSTNKDYVCGMELSEGMVADTTTYEGKVYGFCDPGCKTEFLKDPAKYLSQK